MGTWTRRVAVLAVAALAAAGCGSDGGGDAGGTTEEAQAAAVAATVDTADTDLGTVLVDGDGATLYLFDSDPEDGSSCTDACAETWPPLAGPAEAAGDVDAGLLGTIERPDGSTQVTYDGRPLYHYAADEGPGDVNGQGVGDVWWVVGPDGAAIHDAAASASTSSTAPDAPSY
jgi:predicted lipoprotein with Yx(FWY)xxD motif